MLTSTYVLYVPPSQRYHIGLLDTRPLFIHSNLHTPLVRSCLVCQARSVTLSLRDDFILSFAASTSNSTASRGTFFVVEQPQPWKPVCQLRTS